MIYLSRSLYFYRSHHKLFVVVDIIRVCRLYACAAEVVTRTADRGSSRYCYNYTEVLRSIK